MRFNIKDTSDPDVVDMFDNLVDNALSIPDALDEGAEIVTQEAVNIATSKGLRVTGKGVAGINWQRENEYLRSIGYDPRPHFHLYFHELGTYKHPARPHLRPAVDNTREPFYRLMEQTLFKE